MWDPGLGPSRKDISRKTGELMGIVLHHCSLFSLITALSLRKVFTLGEAGGRTYGNILYYFLQLFCEVYRDVKIKGFKNSTDSYWVLL